MFSQCQNLAKLDAYTRKRVHLIKLHHDRAFAITKEDKVLAIGDNSAGLLGLGHYNPVATFEEIDELGDKTVQEITCGLAHNLALTKTGNIWLWGEFRIDGKLLVRYDTPIHQTGSFVAIVSGAQHSLALDEHRRVWMFGGSGLCEPIHVLGLFGFTITKIECGSFHSVALTDHGQVLVWGSNEFNQLGLGKDIQRQLLPIELKVVDCEQVIRFKSMACSTKTSVFLSEHGELYCTGGRHLLGVRCMCGLLRPMAQVCFESIEVISYKLCDQHFHYDKLFIARACTGTFYVWGWLRNEGDNGGLPTKVEASTIEEVIATFSVFWSFPKMLKNPEPEEFDEQEQICKEEINSAEEFLITFEEPEIIATNYPLSASTSLVAKLANMFDSADLTDFVFRIPSKSGCDYIFAHRVVLMAASNYMCSQLLDEWRDYDMIVLRRFSYDIYYEYIRFLYQGEARCNTIGSCWELYHLAISNGERELRQYCCQAFVENFASSYNCMHLYRWLADKGCYQDMEARVAQFIHRNHIEVPGGVSSLSCPTTTDDNNNFEGLVDDNNNNNTSDAHQTDLAGRLA